MNLAEDPEALDRTIGDALALLHAVRMRPLTDEGGDVTFEDEDPEALDYMTRNVADPAATAMILAIWRAGFLSGPERAVAAAKTLEAGTDPTFVALLQAGRLRVELEFPGSGFAGIRPNES